MNLPEQKAWARLFWEWFIKRSVCQDQCHETDYYDERHREYAACQHMTFYPYTIDEGTNGTWEQHTCEAYLDSLNMVTDEQCLEKYRWMQENCPAWHWYRDYFGEYLFKRLEEE